MKTPIFPGKYHQNGGFSMAMLVYRRVINTETLRIQLIVQGTCWWVFQRLQIQSTHSHDFHHVPKTNAGLRNQAVTWKTWNNDQTQCWWNMVKPPMELREPFSIHMQMVLCTSHENCLWIQNNPILQLDCFNPGDLSQVVKKILETLHHFQNYHPSMKFYKTWTIPNKKIHWNLNLQNHWGFSASGTSSRRRVTMPFPWLWQRIARTWDGGAWNPGNSSEIGKGKEKKIKWNSHSTKDFSVYTVYTGI